MSVKKAEHDGVHLHSWCAIQAPSGRFQGSLASQISRIDELKVNLGLYIPIPTPPPETHTLTYRYTNNKKYLKIKIRFWE